jgi:tetratricopeptide (TPR) repeat protein
MLLLSLAGCSTKKNTAASRNYQAFITRYNVYYNGDEHFKETLKNMENKYEDDYTTYLYPHPAEAKANSKAPQPQGDFTRSIEKAQKSIQLHSIKKRPKRKGGKSSEQQKLWLKREEYNPFLHNAWLMMGRSQYFNGDYSGAAATFYYISRHFSWLPATVTEAQLWQARSYVAFDWVNEAEAILRRVKDDDLTSGKLRGLRDFVAADIAVRRRDFAAAVPALQRAVKSASGAQKVRLNFLLGQCMAQQGDNAGAYKAFSAAGSGSGVTYRTKLNARIKQSEVYSGKNIEPEVRALRRLTRFDRNAPYLDQIYYAIGNLYLTRGDTVHAIENYKLASEKSTRNGIEKAINNVALGQLYFARGEYDLAQPCFAEAVPQLPEDFPDYRTLKRRSDVLDELAVYSQNVTLQDSLLRLSNMTEDEQLAVINKIIEELKKKEKEAEEEAKRAEYEAAQAGNTAANNNSSAKAPTQFTLNTDDSWYFYNTATVAAGRTEFQRRWGSRKLEDDWRRRNKASFSFDDFADNSGNDAATDSVQGGGAGEAPTELTDEEKEAIEHASDPHYPEYYLAQIPKTDEERQTAHDVIQEGLYSMGAILKDKLEDFPAAQQQWDKLLTRYPDNIYRLDVYYNLYIMFMRMERPDLAEHWRQLILSDFAESKYGVALLDEDYIQHLREMPAAQQQMYDRAYEAYLANQNSTVHESYAEMMRRYPLSEIMPKFMFLHALAYVTESRPEEFNSTLREMLERYPETDITPVASAYLKGMAQGRKLNEGSASGNTRGMLWDIRLGNDTVPEGDADSADFEFDPNQPHILALVYSTEEVSANELLFQIARHNFNSFVVKDFDLEQMNFGQLGLLLIKGFANEAEVRHYQSVLEASTVFTLPQEVTPVIITEKNFQTLITKGRTFEEYFQAASAAALDQNESAVLGDDDTE